jgi:hypothetical protein
MPEDKSQAGASEPGHFRKVSSVEITPDATQSALAVDEEIACAWAPVLGRQIELPFLPDWNAQYNIVGLVFASQGPRHRGAYDEVYRLRGKYPLVRFFSYTTYDPTLQDLGSIYDARIQPASGKNPFADPTATEGETGTYEVIIMLHLVDTVCSSSRSSNIPFCRCTSRRTASTGIPMSWRHWPRGPGTRWPWWCCGCTSPTRAGRAHRPTPSGALWTRPSSRS